MPLSGLEICIRRKIAVLRFDADGNVLRDAVSIFNRKSDRGNAVSAKISRSDANRVSNPEQRRPMAPKVETLTASVSASPAALTRGTARPPSNRLTVADQVRAACCRHRFERAKHCCR